jgi:adenylate kinase family enzyme
LEQILKQDRWIIDGNYASTMELRMKECDIVIFLDYPLEVCLQGIRERRGKPRSDIPWIEREPDEEFIKFIQNFHIQNRPLILELMKKYFEKTFFIFSNRTEAEVFLKNLQ